MATIDSNQNSNNIINTISRGYRSTWGNELEMDYATPTDYSEELRQRLEQNDPTVQVMRFPRWWRMNDVDLAQLGEALHENTHLKSLRLDFSPTIITTDEITAAVAANHGAVITVPPLAHLTAQGMGALTAGICQSQIEYLMLDGDCPEEIQRALFQGIWRSTTIEVISYVAKQINIHALRDVLAPVIVMMIKTGPDLPFHLRDLSIRECDMTHEQMEMLSAGLGVNRSIQVMALYNCSLTDQHISIFCAHWQKTSGIEEIDLRGNQITAHGAELVIHACAKHPKMHRIALSDNRGIGYEGLKQLGNGILATTKLDGVCLCSSAPEDYRNVPMQVRDEAFAAMGDALRRNENLQFLILRDNGIGPVGAQSIMRGISNHPNFSNLGLSKNEEIGYEGFKLIGQELGIAGLEDLNLDSCVDEVTKASQTEARMEACQALADGLRANPSVKEIMLGNNGIDALGAQVLVRAMVNHPSLTKLTLAQNHNIGYEGLKWIGQELPNLKLEELDLTECTRSTSENKLQDTPLANAAGQALVDGLKRNITIRQIVLGDMDVQEKWRTEIEFYLDLNRCGRYIMQDENTPLSLWCDILDYLDDDVNLLYYFLREQPWLVIPSSSSSSSCTPAICDKASRKRKSTDP